MLKSHMSIETQNMCLRVGGKRGGGVGNWVDRLRNPLILIIILLFLCKDHNVQVTYVHRISEHVFFVLEGGGGGGGGGGEVLLVNSVWDATFRSSVVCRKKNQQSIDASCTLN